MAKRELSSTIRNLKFMQRAGHRVEQNEKDEDVLPDENFPCSGTLKKCTVIVEGDPHPGPTRGRMSFQSFNPSIDKLNAGASNPRQPEASTTNSDIQNGIISDRENGSAQDGSENLKFCSFNNDANNGDFKRKQLEVVSETKYPNKSLKNVQHDQESSPNNSGSSHKQPKREKLDWRVLRPPAGQKKRE